MTNVAISSSAARPAGAPAQECGPQTQYSQEIRFAVVMYGGVSLAIYINGVAQELLKLVRATAPLRDRDCALPEHKLSDTERVYRKLGKILAHGEAPLHLDILAKEEEDAQKESPLRTRFVVDILSGTSAGGINSVALAKALARNQPLQQLKQLWIDEGDFGRLINDRNSLEGTKLAQQTPPRSLLNSQRMYLKLYEAFDGMDQARPADDLQLVDELDLYVTATDIEGQPVNLTLADKYVEELRHRAVFHFRHRGADSVEGEHDDFGPENSPFLAFAARCTSAFPGAFEPMRLNGIDDVLQRHARDGQPPASANNTDWQPFYADYLRDADGKPTPEAFLNRDFNDGGTLDNKPFGYVIDTLPTRTTQYPVDRKLLYIEPSPEEIGRRPKDNAQVSIVGNVWRSLSTLPRHETIREDLERVLARNRLIDRVNRIIAGVEEDAITRYGSRWDRLPTGRAWDNLTFDEMLTEKGLAWGGYQRLRVSELTDDLARLVTRLVGFDTKSTEFEAIRHLLRVWRQSHYAPNPEQDDQAPDAAAEQAANAKHSEHEFLRRFDILYRLRRLKYVFARINELSSLTSEGLSYGQGPHYLQWCRINAIVSGKLKDDVALPDDQELDAFRAELERLKDQLFTIYLNLYQARQTLWQPAAAGSALQKAIVDLKITGAQLREIVDPRHSTADGMMGFISSSLETRIKQFYEPRTEQFDAFASMIGAELSDLLEHSGDHCRDILAAPGAPSQGARLARRVIGHYFNRFTDYDMVIYPIVYASEVGDELDTVDVFRISPRDATQLFDESKYGPKLAGTLFSNFGAFARRLFRINDLVWGQLDGAERIISALLPGQQDEEIRDELIKEAHCAIIEQEIIPHDIGYQEQQRLHGLLQAALDESTDDQRRLELLSEVQQRVDILKAARDTELVDQDTGPYRWEEPPLSYFQRTHKTTDRSLDAAETVRTAARASRVTGQILQDYAEEQQMSGDALVWLTRLTQIFWGLIEIALPDSIQYLLFRHWLKLLYFFELLMVLLGTLLVNPAVQQFGFVAFVVTVTAHAAVLLVQDALYTERSQPTVLPQATPSKPAKKNWRYALFLILAAFLPLTVLGIAVLGATFGGSGFRQIIDLLVSPSEGPAPSKIFAVGAIVGLPVLIVLMSALWAYQQPWVPPSPPRTDRIMLSARWLPLAGGILVLLLTLPRLVLSPVNPALGGFHSPVLALELVSGEQQLRSVVEAYPRDAISAALTWDSLFFIPAYCVLFICLGMALIKLSKIEISGMKRSDRYVFAMGMLLITCVLASAAADYLENYYSWQAITTQTEQLANAIQLAALVKWWLFVVISALLAAAFLHFGGKLQIVAVLYLVAAAVGAAGLIEYYPLVEWFFALLGLALVPTGVALWSVVRTKRSL